MKITIRTIAALFVAAMLTVSVEAQKPGASKNRVIVHGAFADGSGWQSVFEILTKPGYHVTIVHNPLPQISRL